jgi:hypothetical protein
MFELSPINGLIVKTRPARLGDAPSLQKNCLSANTLEEVENFLKGDVEEMEKATRPDLLQMSMVK